MAWQNPKMDWNAVNIPGPGDFNRIEANIDFIENSVRTPSDAQTPVASGSIIDIQNYFASMIKKITGKSSWIDTPRTTLENAVKLSGDTMTGDLVIEGHYVKIRRPNISEGGWARGLDILDQDDTRLVQFGTRGTVVSGVNSVHFHYIGRTNEDTFIKFYEDKRVTIDGNLGIGTLEPLSLISIQNVGALDDVNLIDFCEINHGSFVLKGMFAGTGGGGNSIKLQTTWADNAMVWRGDGNIGIGIADPQYPLDVNGMIRADGARPIHFDPGAGWAKIKGNAGGWAIGYFFEGSEGTFRGGFGAHGGTDTLNYYYIGIEYNNPLVKVTPEGHMAVKGIGSFGAGAEALSLLPGSNDHTYMQFFPRTASPSSRGGYIGYGTSGSSTLTINNEIGNIYLSPHGGTVNVNGAIEVGTGAEALALKPGTRDYTYMGFYPRTSQPDLLGGYFGYGGTADTEMTMANLRGDVRIITQDKLIIQGSIESNNVKVPIMKKIIEGTAIFDSTSSPHPIELVVEENKHHIFVYNVYCTTYNPIIFGYDANENCAYIDTRAAETLMPRLVLTNHSSTTKSYKYIVYELVV